MDAKTSLIASICDNLIVENINSAKDKVLTEWKFVPTQGLKRESIPLSIQLDVFFRDKFTCRYCSKLTVFIGTLRMINFMMPNEFPYHPNWKWEKTHPAFWELTASCDHLLPVGRGGSNNPENLVTSCYMCNSIKANWTLQELRWDLREVKNNKWDGLTRFFLQIVAQNRVKDKSLNSYYKVLRQRQEIKL